MDFRPGERLRLNWKGSFQRILDRYDKDWNGKAERPRPEAFSAALASRIAALHSGEWAEDVRNARARIAVRRDPMSPAIKFNPDRLPRSAFGIPVEVTDEEGGRDSLTVDAELDAEFSPAFSSGAAVLGFATAFCMPEDVRGKVRLETDRARVYAEEDPCPEADGLKLVPYQKNVPHERHALLAWSWSPGCFSDCGHWSVGGSGSFCEFYGGVLRTPERYFKFKEAVLRQDPKLFEKCAVWDWFENGVLPKLEGGEAVGR